MHCASGSPYTSANGKVYATRDVDSVLDYSFDWRQWLGDTGDTVASAVIEQVGVTAVQMPITTAGVISYMVSGGVAHADASITCRITTSEGRVDDYTIHFINVSL